MLELTKSVLEGGKIFMGGSKQQTLYEMNSVYETGFGINCMYEGIVCWWEKFWKMWQIGLQLVF